MDNIEIKKNRKMNSIIFGDAEMNDIKNLYCNKKYGLQKIANQYGVSKTPIKKILKDFGVLRKSNSDGIKINFNADDILKIKKLYHVDTYNIDSISKMMGVSKGLIAKILDNNWGRRSRSLATTIARTGSKVTENAKENMKLAQQRYALSGKRKQFGGVCKTYMINGIKCCGSYEKFYIEFLLKNNLQLPINANSINTPYGCYYPDFCFGNELIEIKSSYTYDILIGKRISHWSKQYESNQYRKIQWVNENIMPVKITIVNIRQNKIEIIIL
jgi:hypothetical protein